MVRLRDRVLEDSWNGGREITDLAQWAASLTDADLDEFRRVEAGYAVEYGAAVRAEKRARAATAGGAQ
jgi:hypothetical protein